MSPLRDGDATSRAYLTISFAYDIMTHPSRRLAASRVVVLLLPCPSKDSCIIIGADSQVALGPWGWWPRLKLDFSTRSKITGFVRRLQSPHGISVD